ncbi:permease [Rhodopirellula sp. JC740]|uniref:Permease n=1 Tax=Rhodopirellula halodulae TaxID=2894198 RepID=A0ABS8NNS9_9BACT|nr:permease [Rhodopirellula sp. JC740]MCC9645235.1 permease [Rhodopirellula sp. JC740]
MNQSALSMIVGGIIRVVQGFAQASPTLLVGLLIAAILRYYLRPDGTRRLFGGDNWRSLPQSWLVGMLLPVCSIGVLPILLEMRRAKVKPGAMSAFALSAPLFNPLSLLYGLTLSRPLVIILFAIGSLIVVTSLGLIWDAFTKREEKETDAANSETDDEASADQLIGLRRLFATVVHFSREATGQTLVLTILALSGLAVLAAILPYGSMQHSVERDDLWAPLKMLLVAVPVYATPMLAMSQMGMMFQHANSPGASFTLLILGTGMNFATPYWFGRNYGWKAAARWMLALLTIVITISYAINRPLIPPGVEPAGHTHAFDVYTNPLSAFQAVNWATFQELVSKSIDISTTASLIVLGVVILLGLIFRQFGIDEAWLIKGASQKSFSSSIEQGNASRSSLDLIVPSGVIGATMLAGLVAMSIVACFAYYPPAEECLDEISVARAECLSAANSGQVDHAMFWLPVWEDWSRRLEVGTMLRTGTLRPYQRMQGYLIRKKLETLEHELEHDPFEQDETQKVVRDLLATNSRWVRSFRE